MTKKELEEEKFKLRCVIWYSEKYERYENEVYIGYRKFLYEKLDNLYELLEKEKQND